MSQFKMIGWKKDNFTNALSGKGTFKVIFSFAYFILNTVQGTFYALWHIFTIKEIRKHFFLENKRKFLIINPDEERF